MSEVLSVEKGDTVTLLFLLLLSLLDEMSVRFNWHQNYVSIVDDAKILPLFSISVWCF